MDDGDKCLLDVIGDLNALESFLGPFEDQGNNPNNGALDNQRFPELHVNTIAANNIDHNDILSELFSPTLLPTNGIQDSLQSAAALAGITDEDAFDDQPSIEPTLPTNNNQASNAVPQPNLPSSQPIQQNVSIPQPVFISKPNQAQPATSFITSTPAAALPTPAQASASAPVQIQAPAPIQALQPVGNITPQINPQPIQQQQSTITLPVPQSSIGSGIQLSLTPQQLATLQQGGGRIIQSGKTVQIVPNPPPQPQPQIVQAIQPNGMPIQLALIPSNPFAGQHVIIRQPLKAGTEVDNQLVRSPSRNPPNIQPKLTTANQVTKPVNIRPLQVLAPQQITSVASTVAQPSIVLQQPAATAAVAGASAAQALQLTNLAQQQQVAVSGGQNVILHNQVSGVPVVTMGVSRGSIIVMSRSNATTSQQQQLTTTTVNSSTTKPSLAPAPSTTLEMIKPKPALKKKKSKKKKKDEKSKPPTTSAAATTAASVSVTQSVTTLTTSTAGQQTMPAVTYAQQTFVTNNGQTIVMQPPMNPATSGAVPIVQQVNLAALPQGAVSQLQQQQQGTGSLQQQVGQQFQQVTMTLSTGQQIIANIPKPPNSTQMTSEQHQQYLIQQIKLQQQKQQQQQALRAQTPQQILPAVTSSAATNMNSIQPTNSRQMPSPRPPSSGVVPQVQLGQTVVQSGQMLQTAQNQLQTIQNQLQSAQNQLQATQNQVQLGQQQQSQLSPVPKQQLPPQQPGQNQLQPVVFPTSQASLQPQSISSILKSGQQQQQQVAAGSQQQSIQNQVQLVLSSQVSGLKFQVQSQQQQIASPTQQQLVSQPQQQIASSNQQQPQLVSQPQKQIALSNQQQPQLVSRPQQQIASSNQQQPQLVSQPQKQIASTNQQQPVLISQPLQQQQQSQISMSGSGGIHIIPTGQTQGQKEIRTVAELQQFLQQNPQAMKQVLELKRQHILRQQQQLQMQKQQQQLQQQQQQQSGVQSAQSAQANFQQVGQSSSQQQQSVTMVTQRQQQVQPQQPPQIQLTKPPPLPVPQNLGSSESQPTTFQQLMSPPQQATQQQQSQKTQQQQQQAQLLQNQQSLQQQNQQQGQQLPALQSNQQTQQLQTQQQSSTQQLQQQQSLQSSPQSPLQTQQVQPQQQQLQPLTVTTEYSPHKLKTSPAQKILSPYEKQFAAFLQQRTGKSDNAKTSSSGAAAQVGQQKVPELPKPVGSMNPPSSSSTMPNSLSSSFSGSATPSSSTSSSLSSSFGGSATPAPLQPMSIQAPQQQQQQPGQLQQGGGQPQQQQPSITVPQGKIPISPQTQQQLMMIQSKMNKLTAIETPNDQEKAMLLKFQQVQRRIVEGIKAQLVTWNNTAHRYPTQPDHWKFPAPTSQSVSGPAGRMILQQAGTPIKSGSNQPVSVGIQSSMSTSQASMSGAAQQQVSPPKSIKLGLKILSGPNMTPQQKAMVNKLQEQLKKLTPEEAKQLIKQQQLLKISQGKQGGKLIIQPANPQAVVPQSIIGAGKIIIQGNKKDSEKKRKPQGPSKAQLQRSSRVAQRLLKDKVEVQKTDTKTPFKNVWDAVSRLLPFHLCRDEAMTDKELDKAEEEFEGECTGLLQKKQEMLNKYRMLLFQESMRVDPSAEMVMIDRMFMHEEKLSLQANRKEAVERPEIYDQMFANQPEATSNSSTELDTTANTTASIKTDEDGEEAESIVQSPTASTKKFNQSDSFSPNSSPTQAASEANVSFSPNDSKVSSPQSTSSNWLNNHSSKRGTSQSSQDNKSLDESSETEDTMDGSFENATVTKISATNLKVTFRKQKKRTKKRSGGSKKSKSSVSNSVQNHVKHKHDHEDDSAADHLDHTESNSKVVEEDASVNGSTNGTNERVESKPHQRSDSCTPFRKRKFKQITDNLSPVKGGSVAIDRTSSSNSNTPTPVGFKEKISRVDDGAKSVFRFDSIGEEERTNDSVFTKEPDNGGKGHSAKKSDTIKKSDFDFEEVSDPEDGPDMLKEQMESAINSIINLRHHSLSSEPKTPLKSLSLDLPTPTFDMPPIGSLADSARLESNSATNSIQFKSSQDATASLCIDGTSSFSSALGCGDESSAMEGLTYDGSNFGMDDSNDIKAVATQEFFGTGTGSYSNSNNPEEETSIVDDLQKELNLLSQSYEIEEDDDDNASRAADPDLEEAVNSILF